MGEEAGRKVRTGFYRSFHGKELVNLVGTKI